MEGAETLVEQKLSNRKEVSYFAKSHALSKHSSRLLPICWFLWGHIGLADFVKCTGVLLKGVRLRFSDFFCRRTKDNGVLPIMAIHSQLWSLWIAACDRCRISYFYLIDFSKVFGGTDCLLIPRILAGLGGSILWWWILWGLWTPGGTQDGDPGGVETQPYAIAEWWFSERKDAFLGLRRCAETCPKIEGMGLSHIRSKWKILQVWWCNSASFQGQGIHHSYRYNLTIVKHVETWNCWHPKVNSPQAGISQSWPFYSFERPMRWRFSLKKYFGESELDQKKHWSMLRWMWHERRRNQHSPKNQYQVIPGQWSWKSWGVSSLFFVE